ncbi:MAG: M20/M25/M40 family metallo-hydrolase [Geminicoccaceae bacterium]
MIDALLQTVEDRRDDCVALTADLVRIPSVNPPGSYYRPCIDLVGERLAKRDFALTFVRAEGAPGDTDDHPRWNLIARREGRSSGPTVHFNSHVDVVSPGEDWSQDPFGAAVIDGKLHGRGSCDMKGGLASSIVAAEAVIDTFPDFSGAIEISATADEESGGFAGVAYLCETGLISRDRVDHVIIPEPFHRDLVCIGHRGVLWSEIVT